jgi:hypothetical protein
LAGAAFGYYWYSSHEDAYQEALDWGFGPANPELGPRRDWDPNKKNRKKQGREPGEKKRQDPSWQPRNPPKEPPKHTPGRDKRKKFCD